MADVWVFSGPDYVAFTDAEYIEPSLRLSYSEMPVSIQQIFDGSTLKAFEVRRPARIGEERGELLKLHEFRLYSIVSEVMHL